MDGTNVENKEKSEIKSLYNGVMAYGRKDVYIHSLLTYTLESCEWSASSSSRFDSGEKLRVLIE